MRVRISIDGATSADVAMLANVFAVFSQVFKREEMIMAKLDGLQAEVAKVAGVVDSAITLIQGLKAEIIAAGTDQAKLDDLVGQLDAKAAALAEAVAVEPAPAPTDPTA